MSDPRAIICMGDLHRVLTKHRMADVRVQASVAASRSPTSVLPFTGSRASPAHSDSPIIQMGDDSLDQEVTLCDGDRI